MTTDITNWRDPGHNVWGFQNVDKILKVDHIPKSPDASPLPTNQHDFANFKVDLPDKEPVDLSSFLSETETDGIVVLKDGKVVFERYDRTNTSDSSHIVFSIAKSVSGLITGILVQQGKLDLDAKVSTYIHEIKGSAYEHVTIRQLLDMRAGISSDIESAAYKKASGSVPLKPGEPHIDLHTFIPSLSASARVDDSGNSPFEYISVNADLMGWVIETVSGKKFAEVVSELVWQPMGAEKDAYITVDHGGNARTAAGLCCTTRDLARLGQVILEGGRNIFPKTWIDDMINNGSQKAFADGAERALFETEYDTMNYRSFWYVDSGSQTLMATGINGQQLFVSPKHGVVMAKTSSQPERTEWGRVRLTIKGFKELCKVLTP